MWLKIQIYWGGGRLEGNLRTAVVLGLDTGDAGGGQVGDTGEGRDKETKDEKILGGRLGGRLEGNLCTAGLLGLVILDRCPISSQ